MPTRSARLIPSVFSIFGIGLIGIGVLWVHLLGPGWPGSMGIGLGLILELFGDGGRSKRMPLDWPLLLMLLMGLVTLWATASPETTNWQFARLASSLAACYGVARWSRRRQHLVTVGALLIISGVLLALIAPVIVAWNETKGIPIPASVYARFPLLVSDVVHPNIMATLMVLLLPLPLAFVLARADKPAAVRVRVLAVGACGLMGLVLILTKSRGGYLAGGIGVLTVIWFVGKRKLALMLFLIMVALSVWLLTTVTRPQPGVVEGIADAGTWAFRQKVWEVALWMIGDFPFTGVGMGTFNQVAERLYPFPPVTNPGTHNVYLQVAVDLGILGLIAFLALLFLTLSTGVRSIRTLREQDDGLLGTLTIGVTAGIVASMAHGLVDVTVWGSRAMFIPWLLIGFLAAVQMHIQEVASIGRDESESVSLDP